MEKEILFNKYLHGELSESEFADFKSQLDSSEELRQELRIHEVMYNDRAERLKDQLRSEMKQKNVSLTPTKKVSPMLWIRRLAAIFLFAVAAVFAMKFIVDKQNTNIDLADQYISEKHLPPSVEMGGNSVTDHWQLAIEAYRKEEYKIARDQLQLIENLTDEQNLYYALSHMYGDSPQYTKALSIMEMLNESEDSIAKEEALWYSSLLHLILNDKQKAKDGLHKIINQKSWRFKDAEKLLRQSS